MNEIKEAQFVIYELCLGFRYPFREMNDAEPERSDGCFKASKVVLNGILVKEK